MSPYSRAQRKSVRVESRLAMKEVPTQGSPRGPGGRSGAGLDAAALAVEAMGRELLLDVRRAPMIRDSGGVEASRKLVNNNSSPLLFLHKCSF
jgi:hypothetical protein